MKRSNRVTMLPPAGSDVAEPVSLHVEEPISATWRSVRETSIDTVRPSGKAVGR